MAPVCRETKPGLHFNPSGFHKPCISCLQFPCVCNSFCPPCLYSAPSPRTYSWQIQEDSTKTDIIQVMKPPPETSSSLRSSTKRSAASEWTVEVEPATKYRKLGLEPTRPSSNPSGPQRTSDDWITVYSLRSRWRNTQYRIATAFEVSTSETSETSAPAPDPPINSTDDMMDAGIDDIMGAMNQIQMQTMASFEKLPNELLTKIFEELAPTPVTPQGEVTLARAKRTSKLEEHPVSLRRALGRW